MEMEINNGKEICPFLFMHVDVWPIPSHLFDVNYVFFLDNVRKFIVWIVKEDLRKIRFYTNYQVVIIKITLEITKCIKVNDIENW